MKKSNKISRNKIIIAATAAIMAWIGLHNPSDAWIKDRVVKLAGNDRSCSGEQVQAPSGETYILTAGHCSELAVNGSIEAITESGSHIMRRVIAEDPASDLLLLEGLPGISGLDIAKSNHKGQEVRSFTHGKGMDTYETRGALVQDQVIDIMASMITDDAQEAKCESMPKYKASNTEVDAGIFNIQVRACVLHVKETATTAQVQPGSSGGPIVNNSGNLVGVVSATGSGFGWLVTLKDIHNFLVGY